MSPPLDERVESQLGEVVAAARAAFGQDLLSIVLFGSAAEDRLRPTSDVNLVLLLRRFLPEAVAAMRGPLVLAERAIALRVMFLLESEVTDAAAAFALKFDDISRRRRVLFGSDPFAAVAVPRAAAVFQLRQVLLNTLLRMREQLASRGEPEDQLALVIANLAGPLRACAAELLSLEGKPPSSPRQALEEVLGRPLPEVSQAREQGRLRAGEGLRVLLELLALCDAMRARAARLT